MDKLKTFFTSYPAKKYKKSETILDDENPENIFYIKSGYIKAYTISENGEEKLILIYKQGEIFPLKWAISDIDNNFFYSAASDCVLHIIPKADLKDFLRSDSQAVLHLFEQCLNINKELEDRIQNLELTKAHMRITYLLKYLANRFGMVDKHGKIILDLRLAHHDIASLVALTRETVSIEMKKLENSGVISHDKTKTYIDIGKLDS